MHDSIIDAVAEVMCSAAAEKILSHYKALSAGDIIEKTPDELMAVSDREDEQVITRALLKLRPDSRVVGGEECAANSSLL